MKVQIIRDQAVWERETFFVEVPDGLQGDELTEAIELAEDDYCGSCGYGDDPSYSKEILDEPVYGIDIDRKAVLPGGNEIEY